MPLKRGGANTNIVAPKTPSIMKNETKPKPEEDEEDDDDEDALNMYTTCDNAPTKQSLGSEMLRLSLIVISYALFILTLPLSLFWCLKVVKEYERVVIFRLGRLLGGGSRGPGLIFMLPCVDNSKTLDLRVVSFEVPPQEILSKDSVTVSVDAVVYFRISDPVASVTNVTDAFYSTKLLAQTTLRNILGTKTLGDMLLERENIAQSIENVLFQATADWGVRVERVEVKDLRLPEQLMRAMAAEAEATREARAKVIAAEGEKRASCALRAASDTICESPSALHLRYLQTLSSIAAEQSSTIMFPVPMQMKNLLNVTDLLSAGILGSVPKKKKPKTSETISTQTGEIDAAPELTRSESNKLQDRRVKFDRKFSDSTMAKSDGTPAHKPKVLIGREKRKIVFRAHTIGEEPRYAAENTNSAKEDGMSEAVIRSEPDMKIDTSITV